MNVSNYICFVGFNIFLINNWIGFLFLFFHIEIPLLVIDGFTFVFSVICEQTDHTNLTHLASVFLSFPFPCTCFFLLFVNEIQRAGFIITR